MRQEPDSRAPELRDELASAGSPPEESRARAILLKISNQKWLLIRALERVLRLLVTLLPGPIAADQSKSRSTRILVIEYWNIGDLAILVPFLTQLRSTFPSAHIALLINANLRFFLETQDLVNEFIPIRVPWAQHFSRWKKYNPFSALWAPFLRNVWNLRKKRFDWAFSGRMDIRDNFLMWLTGAARRIGYGVGGGGFLLTDRASPDLSRPHRTDVWLQLLSAVGGPAGNCKGNFKLATADREAADAYLRHLGVPDRAFLVGVHSGARMPVRRWGDDRFAEVARRILDDQNVHVLWFIEPGSASKPPSLQRCHTAALDFRSFLALLSRCRLLICNDSGPMHLANLLGVPVVAVFGPQNPMWFGPRGAKDRVVIKPEMWCRPCFDYCIFDQPYCLRAITSGEVMSSVREALRHIDPEPPVHAEKLPVTISGQRTRNV